MGFSPLVVSQIVELEHDFVHAASSFVQLLLPSLLEFALKLEPLLLLVLAPDLLELADAAAARWVPVEGKELLGLIGASSADIRQRRMLHEDVAPPAVEE